MLSLREAMNQLLEESYVRPALPGGAGQAGRAQTLPLDVAERENAYVVTASLPGIRPEDVQVTVLGDTVTIRAESKTQEERQVGGYLLRERHSGALQRTVTLPGPINAEDVSADYEHGILTLTLPKSQASMPRRIQVRSGAPGQGAGQVRLGGGEGAPAGGGQPPIEAMSRPTEGSAGQGTGGTTEAGSGGRQGGTTRGTRGGRGAAGSGASQSSGSTGGSGGTRGRQRRQSPGSTER
jgi:HSP20 family protein